MWPRIISSIAIAVIFLSGIFLYPKIYYFTIALCTIIMTLEWLNMVKYNLFFSIIGLLLIFIISSSLTYLRWICHDYSLLLLYFTTIWFTDMSALIGGKLLEGPKLAPRISANKTYSGLIVGVLAGTLNSYFMQYLPEFDLTAYLYLNQINLALLGFVTAVLSQAGDLFISAFKRKFNIKDFSNIIPGHGGVLDRLDSAVFTGPLFVLLSLA